MEKDPAGAEGCFERARLQSCRNRAIALSALAAERALSAIRHFFTIFPLPLENQALVVLFSGDALAVKVFKKGNRIFAGEAGQ